MKNLRKLSWLLIALCAITFTSCEELLEELEEDCNDGWGELCVENKSLHTVQKVIINGASYGTLDPGDKECFSVPVGATTLEFRGVNGGSGCNPCVNNIPDCGVINKSCSY